MCASVKIKSMKTKVILVQSDCDPIFNQTFNFVGNYLFVIIKSFFNKITKINSNKIISTIIKRIFQILFFLYSLLNLNCISIFIYKFRSLLL
jgi:hypothetical protein